MYADTGYHHLLKDLSTQLVNHGFGELTLRVTTPVGNTKSRVEICCGKSYMIIINRDNKIKEDL